MNNTAKLIGVFSIFTVALVICCPGDTYGATNEQLEERIEELEKKVKDSDQNQHALAPYINDVGGRMQYDMTFNTDDSDSLISDVANGNSLEDGSQFRRLRFYFSGELSEFVGYKFQTDVSNRSVSVLDAYFNFHDLPWVGDILIGRFNESFTLDENTSSKYLTFMTRSMLSDAFQRGWNNGVQWHNSYADRTINLTVNGFYSNDNGGASINSTGGRFDVSSRVSVPVLYENDGRKVLHLGGGYSIRQPNNDNDTFSSGIEPEISQTDNFVSVRFPNVESYEIYNLELAGVKGPFSVQSEYAELETDRTTGPEPELDSWYAQASYFLTGEHRPYSRSGGSFGRVKPSSPFIGWSQYPESGGPGAWEVALRHSNIDYSDAVNITRSNSEQAADLDVTTAGLNWYPNSHTRWILNYARANQDKLGEADYVTTRFQVDF